MKSRTSTHQHEANLEQEAEKVEMELSILQKFLAAAPRLREESRFLLPPPEEIAMQIPTAPNRTDFKRIQRTSYYYRIKLVTLLSIFLMASVWFVDRLLTAMR